MKCFTIGILAVVVAAGVVAGGAEQAQNAERLLKAAMNTEMVDGDLKAAIEQCQKIAAGSDRSIAVQALLRMPDQRFLLFARDNGDRDRPNVPGVCQSREAKLRRSVLRCPPGSSRQPCIQMAGRSSSGPLTWTLRTYVPTCGSANPGTTRTAMRTSAASNSKSLRSAVTTVAPCRRAVSAMSASF